MNYTLHKSDINQDKTFKVKNNDNKKTNLDGIAKKVFEDKKQEVSKLAQQKKDYSLEYHVVGSTFFKEASDKDNDKDTIEILGKKYKLSEGRLSFTRGYLYVGNNEFVRVATRIPFILWFTLFILLLLGLCWGLRSCEQTSGGTDNTTSTIESTEITDGTSLDIDIDGTDEGDIVPNQTTQNTVEEEFIEISVYPQMVVNNDIQTIPLYNGENNTVYFVFNIYEGDTLLHQTGLIPPGYRVQWNAYEALESGEHDITMVIECYDVDTQAACDGATTHCSIIVE